MGGAQGIHQLGEFRKVAGSEVRNLRLANNEQRINMACIGCAGAAFEMASRPAKSPFKSEIATMSCPPTATDET